MSIQEKKQKHKEDFRSKILDAAKKLFVEEGIEATSIRKIAKAIAFSPTTIYLYYKDKSDIVYALHLEGFSLLRSQMQVLMHVENPFERLIAIGKAYLSFAVNEPGYYELLFMMKEPMQFLEDQCIDGEWEEGDRVFDLLQETIQDCQKAGFFTGMDTSTLSLQAWSTVHGIASLFISGHLKKMNNLLFAAADEATFLENTFQLYVNMLKRLK
ncbi:TetR/AcrR family transcriptional regulator [Sphingobacterium sp. lm-10]|uniref:TetR/AcrR family transcriptional regulator n=1 Tax=Sphingobacterium sp. lm-10 TaxID=2944904 RepID=UPI002020F49D|nr:TetR/AcrR family transcriptional regulator [Sphingobacterium sp. lm-10]MCL7986490.1 TetR/AcrR family transcriptional regulator [Sphingobacterium sp. lm-10]